MKLPLIFFILSLGFAGCNLFDKQASQEIDIYLEFNKTLSNSNKIIESQINNSLKNLEQKTLEVKTSNQN